MKEITRTKNMKNKKKTRDQITNPTTNTESTKKAKSIIKTIRDILLPLFITIFMVAVSAFLTYHAYELWDLKINGEVIETTYVQKSGSKFVNINGSQLIVWGFRKFNIWEEKEGDIRVIWKEDCIFDQVLDYDKNIGILIFETFRGLMGIAFFWYLYFAFKS